MKKSKQSKKSGGQNFSWSFVVVCFLIGGAILLNIVSNRSVVPNKTNNIISDLQTYTNTKYGFEFKYPKGLVLKEVDTQMGSNIGIQLSFNYHNNIQPISFNIFPAVGYKDSMAAFIGVNNFADDVVNVLEKKNDIISINGLPALNYCSIPGHIDYCSTFIMHNNNLFMFDYSESIPNYYKEILATFRFLQPIDQEETINWQTYRNEEGGYTIMRPESWKLKNYIKSDLIKAGTNDLIDNYLALDKNNITDLGPGYLGQIVIEKSRLDLSEIEKSMPANSSKNVFISGLSAKRFEYQTGEDDMDGKGVVIEYVLVNNGVRYMLGYQGSLNKENEDIFEKIVSSFAFID